MSLFGSHRTVTPQFTGLQVQSSSSALPIPIVYGINRLAPNVIWTGSFQTQQVQSGGKGGLFSGGSSTSYDYKSALVLGICEGPINSIGSVFYNQGTYTPTALNLSLLSGTTPQTAWGYLAASFPTQALGYQGTALAVSSSFDLGSSASIGNLAFEIYGCLYTSAVVNVHDADPAMVVGDFLTNAQYGVGFPTASINATTLYGSSGDGSYQTYCQAMGLAFSPCLTDQEAGSSILARWLQLTNSTAVWSGGLLKFVPFGDAPATGMLSSGASVTFQPNVTPVYDLADDDFLYEDGTDPVVVTRSDPYSASNVQRLEILNRAPTTNSGAPTGTIPNYYAPTPIEARDQNAIELYGLRVGSTITAHEICDMTVGSIAAQLILQRGLYVRNTYAFRLSWEYCLLEPMDLVTLTDSGLGLSKTPVRIISIEEDSSGLLSVTAEEFPGTVATTSGYAVDGAATPAFNRSVTPASVNPPVILEPPSDLTAGVEQLWVGLSGGTAGVADPNWGGATIYASTDNATYTQVGQVKEPARQGVLTAALGSLPGLPSDTLVVSFAESGATVVAGSTPTQVVVDGEILSFASATLTGAAAYSLGSLKRAIYAQRGGVHAAGAQALILDAKVFKYTLPAGMIGQPLWFKFASFNIFGGTQQDLSTCTAYQVTPVGSGLFGPVSQAIATGQSLDESLASQPVTETDDDGLASDPYTDTIDMGLASDAAASLAVQSGGTGAVTPGGARTNIGAAASGANGDITALTGLTTPLSVAQGGSGAGTAAAARASLGAAASGANADITSLTNLAGLGIGTSADTTTNLFAMKSANALFDNAGAGVAIAINKASASLSAFHQFETAYSGRAQAGLLGSDRYRVFVSAAGTTYTQALDIDPATGHIGLAGYTADANNSLGVLGTAFLFSAAVDSCRFTFSKVAAANDATLSFQTNFSTRAIIGTTGSDGYQLKVSSNGSAYYQVYVVDQTTGNAAFKALMSVAAYTVAGLPTGLNGALAFASNGRKVGEAAGSGTGVVVAFSNGSWRRLSDDTVVAS